MAELRQTHLDRVITAVHDPRQTLGPDDNRSKIVLTKTMSASGMNYGQIEPKIEPLVRAVRDAGFVTFSSCEGHKDYEAAPLRFASVAFFASENEARKVHQSLVDLQPRLACFWSIRGCFVHDRVIIGEWALGWILENCGVRGDTDTYEAYVNESVEAAWNKDIPALGEMFRNFKHT
jgi:hypothetical protein